MYNANVIAGPAPNTLVSVVVDRSRGSILQPKGGVRMVCVLRRMGFLGVAKAQAAVAAQWVTPLCRAVAVEAPSARRDGRNRAEAPSRNALSDAAFFD